MKTKNLLFALCLTITLGSINKIAKSQCSAVGNGISACIYALRTDTVHDLLCIGGGFKNSGTDSIKNCGSWNTTAFSSFGTGTVNGVSDTVLCMTIFNGNLYVGGMFLKAGGVTVNGVAMWDGSTWHAVGSGFDVSVHTLAVYNGALYAGGDFLNSGTTPTKHIAKLVGTQWTAVGGGINDDVDVMYPWNGDLYIGGDFTQAGTITANHVCKWNDVSFICRGYV